MKENEDFLGLHNLVAPRGARKAKKRLGRGESSGHGKTSGRGNKGQKARKSGNVRIAFEGGQMPLAQRLPKKGFTSPYAKIDIVNLRHLNERFEENAVIDPKTLVAAGLLSDIKCEVKILGVGEAKRGLSLHVHAISASARSKVENAGGSVTILK